ncbi:hypothetical protein FI667_g6481, partial [Globisporangium splendens]
MASLSDEEQQLIERDREENPALSQSCRSINGDSKCEIIKKIFRQCPGQSKELISNRKEITEDEHGGELSAGDFFNRERMDPKGGDDSGFGTFFNPFQRYGCQDASLASIFGGGSFFGGGDNSIFDQFEREFESMPSHPPAEPPARSPDLVMLACLMFDSVSQARPDEKRDIFEGYTGRVEEI